jgi:hypothetical protein
VAVNPDPYISPAPITEQQQEKTDSPAEIGSLSGLALYICCLALALYIA